MPECPHRLSTHLACLLNAKSYVHYMVVYLQGVHPYPPPNHDLLQVVKLVVTLMSYLVGLGFGFSEHVENHVPHKGMYSCLSFCSECSSHCTGVEGQLIIGPIGSIETCCIATSWAKNGCVAFPICIPSFSMPLHNLHLP